jgi:predicted phosphodiesterase
MSRPQTAKGIKVKEVLKKFPDKSMRWIALYLTSKYPDMFNRFESARTMVRMYRGVHQGSKTLKPEHIIPEIPAPAMETKKKWEPRSIRLKKALVLSDIHIPFHDKEALECAINYGVQHNCKDIFLNGDVLDFYQFSRFEKDPDVRVAEKELQDWIQIKNILEHEFSGRKIFKLGNHDERYEKYIKDRAPELFNISNKFSFKSIYELENWDVIGEKRTIKSGKLNIIHGHEYKGGIISPVNPARGVFLKAKANTLVGHNHRTSQHGGRTINQSNITCWSTGCLCDLHPQYMPNNEWNHGFAIVDMTTDDEFLVINKEIDNGKVY